MLLSLTLAGGGNGREGWLRPPLPCFVANVLTLTESIRACDPGHSYFKAAATAAHFSYTQAQVQAGPKTKFLTGILFLDPAGALVECCDKTVLSEQTEVQNIPEQGDTDLESPDEELGATVSPSSLTLGHKEQFTLFSSVTSLARTLKPSTVKKTPK